jgi:hypothetical protein
VLLTFPDGRTRLVKPAGIRWYWVTEIFTIYTVNGYLRLASEQPVYSRKEWIPACSIEEGMPLNAFGTVTEIKHERVLAPICRLLFTQPAVILSKGAYLYLPIENENTRNDHTHEYCEEAADQGPFGP